MPEVVRQSIATASRAIWWDRIDQPPAGLIGSRPREKENERCAGTPHFLYTRTALEEQLPLPGNPPPLLRGPFRRSTKKPIVAVQGTRDNRLASTKSNKRRQRGAVRLPCNRYSAPYALFVCLFFWGSIRWP